MSTIKTKGIILKQSDFKEANRILTIFTKDFGIINAVAYGAKSIRNKNSASTQVMTYADFILLKTNKDMMSIQSAEIIDSFFGVKEDIVKLSLCVYFGDLIYSLLNTNSPDEDMLSLILNSVYALSYKDYSLEKVKAVFELRAMAYGGYMPNISCCVGCGNIDNISHFNAKSGGIMCRSCAKIGSTPIDAEIYHTLSYILTADTKKMLSFNASDEVIKKLCEISEEYVLTYCDKKFKSLDYYKQININ